MAQSDPKAAQQQLGEAILKAWTDDGYKQRLREDPKAALQEVGFTVSEGVKVNVLEESDDVAYFVIPNKPADLNVSDFRSEGGALCWCF